MQRITCLAPASVLVLAGSGAALAQVPLDQADPAYIENSLPAASQPAEKPVSPPSTNVETGRALAMAPSGSMVARDIEITGNREIASAALKVAAEPYLERSLDQDGLRNLAGAVGAAARRLGYPFATATVRRDPSRPGDLIVDLDEGQVTAVRLLGSTNATADRILQKLVTGRPVTTRELERTILLAGDVPGVRIISSRYMRQNGFGILFVEVKEDRASLYAQIDNRGSDEVGPLRSTILGSARSVITSGDQVNVVLAQTPANPKEFVFARLRYDIPVDDQGAVVTFSGSAGRINPGASLRRLDVVGHSRDAAIAYQRPLLRRRSTSLWANVELRHATSDQSLRSDRIRDDKLATLTGTMSGEAELAGGRLRGDAGVIWGLPFAGVTRRGDNLASRTDGSGRFVVGHLWMEWTRTIKGPLSARLSGEAQIASRPLLAAMELGVGGASFGRAYDYGERTGDQGVLGAAELSVQLPRPTFAEIIRSLQVYGFADGGYVDNLRDGFGGGSLASAGGGLRVAVANLVFNLEAAAPLNADRLDTSSRSPRITLRGAAQF